MTLRKTTSYTRVLAALHDESGAVSVDWVVLSAATLTLGMGAATLVQTGTVSLGEAINATLSSTQSNDSGFSFYRLTGKIKGASNSRRCWQATWTARQSSCARIQAI